jgi:hypothetical protein
VPAVTRRYHSRWLVVLALFALATAAWLACPDVPIAASDAAAPGDTLTIAAHAHATVATVTRAPMPCARLEQPRHEIVHLDASLTGPTDATLAARTPLYALLRVFRL